MGLGMRAAVCLWAGEHLAQGALVGDSGCGALQLRTPCGVAVLEFSPVRESRVESVQFPDC